MTKKIWYKELTDEIAAINEEAQSPKEAAVNTVAMLREKQSGKLIITDSEQPKKKLGGK